MPAERLSRKDALFLFIVFGGFWLLLEAAAYLKIASEDKTVLRIFDNSGNGALASIGVKTRFSQQWKQPEFSVSVRLNNLGLREDADYRGEPIDIGFYGDSFTFGHGVEADQRYSDRLREYFPHKRIVSFSYLNGWAPPHYYLFMRQHPEMIPRIGVLGLFLGNDLSSDIDETELQTDARGELVRADSRVREVSTRGFLVVRDTNPVTRSMRRSWVGEWLLRSGQLERLGLRPRPPVPNVNAPSWKDLELGKIGQTGAVSLEYVRKMNERLSASGGRLVVFLIPWSYYVGDYKSYWSDALIQQVKEHQSLPKRVLAWCAANGVECINPVEDFRKTERGGTRLYFRVDAHWNAAGHSVAARILADYLKSRERAVAHLQERGSR